MKRPDNHSNNLYAFVIRRTSVSFVGELDQVEQLRNRIVDLEAQLQNKEHQLNQERENGNRKFHALTEKLPIVLYTLHTEGIVTMSEGKGLAAIGSRPGQSVGKNIFEMYKDLPETNTYIRRALAGEEIQAPIQIGPVYMQTWYSPLRDENGTVNGMLGLAIDISERKKAETELRESKNRLELAFGAANLGSWDWNMITNDVIFDDGFNRMLGYEPGGLGNELSGFSNNLHPDDIERTFKAVSDYTEGRAPKYDIEFRLKHKDGSWRWVSATGLVVERQADGKTVRMIGVNQDITDRKKADLELHESKNRLELALESAHLGLWDGNWNSQRFVVDERYERMLGFAPGELAGEHPTSQSNVHPDDLPRLLSAMTEYVAGKAPVYSVEFRTQTKNGDWKWISAKAEIVERDADGKPLRLAGINQDITERKQAEVEMRESKDRLELALDIAQLGQWDANLINNKTKFDDRYEKILGFLPGELAGENPTRVSNIHPDDMTQMFEKVMNYATGKTSEYEAEFRTETRDGNWKWIYAKAEIVERMPDGTPLRLAGVNQDITARKLAEQERETLLNSEREARREAQEALRMKDLFLATMSHELRTPLNAMIGFQHLMFSQQLDADNSHMAERSIANSQRLLNLINNILDISRIATGGLKIVPVNMSVRNLAIGIGTDLNLQAKEKGLKLKIEVADEVPAQILHDEERMGQIMLNLVGNALKFTEPNGTITLRLNSKDERLIIEVQDTGIGIPASQKHVIFDDFVQLDNSSTRKHQGAGLGLAIVKRLALLMQGSITVESEIGQGSTFVVTLPLNLKPEMYQ